MLVNQFIFYFTFHFIPWDWEQLIVLLEAVDQGFDLSFLVLQPGDVVCNIDSTDCENRYDCDQDSVRDVEYANLDSAIAFVL